MGKAQRINEGNQSTSGLFRDFEIELWRVWDLVDDELYNTKAARDYIGVKLGAPWIHGGGLILHEHRLVQWIGPDTAHFALLYAPPGRFGTARNSSSFGRTESIDFFVPRWSVRDMGSNAIPPKAYVKEEPLRIHRGKTIQIEYRTLSAAGFMKDRILGRAQLASGGLFTIQSGGPHSNQFDGASVRETGRGQLEVAYWFHSFGWVRAMNEATLISPISAPGLSPLDEYVSGVGKDGVPFLDRTEREELYLEFDNSFLPGL